MSQGKIWKAIFIAIIAAVPTGLCRRVAYADYPGDTMGEAHQAGLVVFLDGGKRLAMAGMQPQEFVKIYNAETGQQEKVLPASGSVYASPDGQTLITASSGSFLPLLYPQRDGTPAQTPGAAPEVAPAIQFWDAAGNPKGALPDMYAFDFEFSPDSKTVAVAALDVNTLKQMMTVKRLTDIPALRQQLVLVDLATGLPSLPDQGAHLWSPDRDIYAGTFRHLKDRFAMFSPNSQWLVTKGEIFPLGSGTLRLWDTKGNLLATVTAPPAREVPAGRAASVEEAVRQFEKWHGRTALPAERELLTLTKGKAISHSSLMDDLQIKAFIQEHQKENGRPPSAAEIAQLREYLKPNATDNFVQKSLEQHLGRPLTADEKLALREQPWTGSEPETEARPEIKWAREVLKRPLTNTEKHDLLNVLVMRGFSPDSKYALVENSSLPRSVPGKPMKTHYEQAYLWELPTDKLIPLRPEDAEWIRPTIDEFTFFPDATTLAAPSLDQGIVLWRNGTPHSALELADGDDLQGINVSPDGQWLAAFGSNIPGAARVLLDIMRDKLSVEEAEAMPENQVVRLYHRDSPRVRLTLQGPAKKEPVSPAFSPNNAAFALAYKPVRDEPGGEFGAALEDIDLAGGNIPRELGGKPQDNSSEVRVWKLPDGKMTTIRPGHPDVEALRFVGNNLLLVSFDATQNIDSQLWDITTGRQRELVGKVPGYEVVRWQDAEKRYPQVMANWANGGLSAVSGSLQEALNREQRKTVVTTPGMTVSPDGTTLISTGFNMDQRVIWIWDAQSGQQKSVIQLPMLAGSPVMLYPVPLQQAFANSAATTVPAGLLAIPGLADGKMPQIPGLPPGFLPPGINANDDEEEEEEEEEEQPAPRGRKKNQKKPGVQFPGLPF